MWCVVVVFFCFLNVLLCDSCGVCVVLCCLMYVWVWLFDCVMYVVDVFLYIVCVFVVDG